jgi:hypothetical protein
MAKHEEISVSMWGKVFIYWVYCFLYKQQLHLTIVHVFCKRQGSP